MKNFIKKLFGIEPKKQNIIISKATIMKMHERAVANRDAEIKRQIDKLGEKYLCHPKNHVKKKRVVDKRWKYYAGMHVNESAMKR